MIILILNKDQLTWLLTPKTTSTIKSTQLRHTHNDSTKWHLSAPRDLERAAVWMRMRLPVAWMSFSLSSIRIICSFCFTISTSVSLAKSSILTAVRCAPVKSSFYYCWRRSPSSPTCFAPSCYDSRSSVPLSSEISWIAGLGCCSSRLSSLPFSFFKVLCYSRNNFNYLPNSGSLEDCAPSISLLIYRNCFLHLFN